MKALRYCLYRFGAWLKETFNADRKAVFWIWNIGHCLTNRYKDFRGCRGKRN
jgi:hypothetical protein